MERIVKDIRFAENLKALRLKEGINQSQLAYCLGVSTGIISLWEHGKREPLMYSLVAIAAYFNVTIDDLVGYSVVN